MVQTEKHILNNMNFVLGQNIRTYMYSMMYYTVELLRTLIPDEKLRTVKREVKGPLFLNRL